jgi:hypothetical protein
VKLKMAYISDKRLTVGGESKMAARERKQKASIL